MGSASNFNEMTFLEHLEELRWILIKSIAAVLLCALPCIVFWKHIFDLLLVYPLRFAEPAPLLIYTNPAQSVILSLKIAFAVATVIAAPIVSFQFWKFLSPALQKNEKKMILPVASLSTLFFFAGILFSYFSLPYLLKFLTSYAAGRLDPVFRADEYLGFMIKISLSLGVVFQMPVISFTLARTGILTHKFLIRNLSYATVAMFSVAAVLTPPDIFSQALIVLPLASLYIISVLITALAERKRS